MSLSKTQREFTKSIGELIQFAHLCGFELTMGDAYRDPRLHGEFGEKKSYGASKSTHKLRLAIDFNLFVDGKYIQDSEHEAWDTLHKAWVKLGGSERIPKDANHFSFEYYGVR